MKIALYVGEHTKDTPGVRLGWWATRLVQKGRFKRVTHVEAILEEHEDGSVTIGSASLRDGGVRTKRCHLDAGNWLIVNVHAWSASRAARWFAEHAGERYDWRGAFASCMPFSWGRKDEWFCNGSVGAAVGLESPETFGPAQFAAICVTFGVKHG